jgi:hypothetical protein
VATVYPINIDTSATLPTVVDNFTPVRAVTVNTLRDAILAIEGALGVQPASTYGTVSARLDFIESMLNSDAVTFSGDLMGTYTSQTVVGIQGTPIAVGVPSGGQVLGYNGSTWASTSVTGDVTGPIDANTVGFRKSFLFMGA